MSEWGVLFITIEWPKFVTHDNKINRSINQSIRKKRLFVKSTSRCLFLFSFLLFFFLVTDKTAHSCIAWYPPIGGFAHSLQNEDSMEIQTSERYTIDSTTRDKQRLPEI